MRTLLACALIVIAGAASGSGSGSNLETADENLDSLIQVEGRFETTSIRPGADFNRFNLVLVSDVEIEPKKEKRLSPNQSTGRLLGSRSANRTTPNRKEIQKFKELIGDAFVECVEKDREFSVTQQSGPDTLLVQIRVLDMISDLPSKSSLRTLTATTVIAEGTIDVDVVDAETGTTLARMTDRRRIFFSPTTSEDGPPQPADVWAEVANWAKRAAADSLSELKRFRSL